MFAWLGATEKMGGCGARQGDEKRVHEGRGWKRMAVKGRREHRSGQGAVRENQRIEQKTGGEDRKAQETSFKGSISYSN